MVHVHTTRAVCLCVCEGRGLSIISALFVKGIVLTLAFI